VRQVALCGHVLMEHARDVVVFFNTRQHFRTLWEMTATTFINVSTAKPLSGFTAKDSDSPRTQLLVANLVVLAKNTSA